MFLLAVLFGISRGHRSAEVCCLAEIRGITGKWPPPTPSRGSAAEQNWVHCPFCFQCHDNKTNSFTFTIFFFLTEANPSRNFQSSESKVKLHSVSPSVFVYLNCTQYFNKNYKYSDYIGVSWKDWSDLLISYYILLKKNSTQYQLTILSQSSFILRG